MENCDGGVVRMHSHKLLCRPEGSLQEQLGELTLPGVKGDGGRRSRWSELFSFQSIGELTMENPTSVGGKRSVDRVDEGP